MDRSTLLKNSRFALLALLAVLVAGALYMFRAVILPFAVAAFLAYLLAPIITRASRQEIRGRKIPRGVSILLVYALFVGMLTLMGLTMGPKLTAEVNALVRHLPAALKQIEKKWIVPFEENVNDWLSEFVTPPDQEIDPVEELALATDEEQPEVLQNGGPKDGLAQLAEDYTFVVRPLEDGQYEVVPRRKRTKLEEQQQGGWEFRGQISSAYRQFRSTFESNILELLRTSRRYVIAVVSSFFTTFLVLMVSAFILLDPQRFHKFMCSMVPARNQHQYEALIYSLDRGLSGVVRGQVMICLVNGTATGIGVAILGVPFVFTLSLLATLFSLIPIFGVLISTIPILLMALTVSFSTALMALVWILVIHFIEGNFLNPKIIGDSAKIHPVFIVFALVAGQYLGGILGALVAVPAFSLIQNSFLFLKSLTEHAEATA